MMHRLRDESGSALVVAITLMAVMMAFGAATLAAVDTQQQQAGKERIAESRFNVTEAVLNAQAFQLARKWPIVPKVGVPQPFPACTGTVGGAAPADARCPDPTQLSAAFGGADFSGATWTTIVRDNDGPNATYYDDAVTPSGLAYDANQDDRMWVRARASLNGKTRTIVALVRLQRQPVTFPQKAVVAGKVAVGANGRQTVLDSKGDAAEPVGIAVRCDPPTDCVSSNMMDPKRKQLVGSVSGFPAGPVLDDQTIALLEAQAASTGTHYATCPGSLPTTGGLIVVIDAGPCSYNAVSVFTADDPGVIVVKSGSIQFGGSSVVNGTIYALNKSTPPSSGWLVTLSGRATVNGAVFIDGPGGLYIQDMAAKVSFRQPTIEPPPVTGTGTVVRSTWRELPGG